MRRAAGSSLAVLLVLAASGQAAEVPNPSFETGASAPDGWTLEGGAGTWLAEGAADGARAVAAAGSGEDSSFWRSAPVTFEPGGLYVLFFRARRLSGAGGVAISGPAFCNRDLAGLEAQWREYRSIFVAPSDPAPDLAWLRFGQWHLNGSVAFDAVRLARGRALHAKGADGLELGEGERLAGDRYEFTAPFETESRNYARPLVGYRGRFNTNRWVLGEGDFVLYAHRIGSRRQTAAEVDVAVTWHAAGELVVEASADGRRWTTLGGLAAVGRKTFAVPGALLPAPEIRVRLRARAGAEAAGTSGPSSLQVGAYAYRASVDGPRAALEGRTRYVAIHAEDPRVGVTFETLGDMTPGGQNLLEARLANTTGAPLAIRPAIRTLRDGEPQTGATYTGTLPPAERWWRFPYPVPGPGEYRLIVTLGDDLDFEAETWFRVSGLHATDYGAALPVTSGAVAVWWSSAGRKVSETRPPPAGGLPAIRIAAARNETEAAQLVLRPARPLRGLTVRASDLRGPGGAMIPSGRVDLLRVGYLDVARPTDEAGSAERWPDPLPPLRAPVDLPADRNQPIWVRVRVPRDAAAGVYEGTLSLSATGWSASVRLTLEVFAFALPDRATLTTAFGFDPWLAFRYHGAKTETDRRTVLERYLENLAAHRVSPYDPAPLDPFVTTWPSAGSFEGGTRDDSTAAAGRWSLKVEDLSPAAQPSARTVAPISIPPGGLRLSFRHRAERGHRFLAALVHLDTSGAWMPGRNLDFPLEGTGRWESFSRTITAFPPGARSVRLHLYGTEWRDDGSPVGAAWYDEVSLADAGTGVPLVSGGGFEPVRPEELVPNIEWTAWDREMARVRRAYGFNSFVLPVPGLGGGTFHARSDPSLLGYPEDSPQYEAALRNWCAAASAHLEARGWLKDAFVYWFDEPDPKDYAFVMNGFRKLKTYCPGLTRMLTEQPEPPLHGGPNLWCPVLDAWDAARAAERRAAGDRFWWYVCTVPKHPYPGQFIDRASPDLRVWSWLTWKEGVEGLLLWQTNYWTSAAAYPDPTRPQNPYADPMSWETGYGAGPGTRHPWGNGDGRLIYPPVSCADGSPSAPVLDGPVDSIRWEQLRDGIEDYEYFAILRRLLSERGAALPAADRDRYASLLEVPADIAASLTAWTPVPDPIERHRERLARAIEALSR